MAFVKETLIMLLLLNISLIFAKKLSNGPITADFNNFLLSKNLGMFDFARTDMGDHGSFGGRTNKDEKIDNPPVIFFHGNSDSALRTNDFSTGWTDTVDYFRSRGYSMSELYGTSWGNTTTSMAVYRDHDCTTLIRLRQFVNAVLDYTRSPLINIVGHSMGVTLARKIIQGGSVEGPDGKCFLGYPLTRYVRNFLGISGANFGLCTCVSETALLPTCNPQNGLFPGNTCGAMNSSFCGISPLPINCNSPKYSSFLTDLNTNSATEGAHIFSMWSKDDDLIGFGDQVWGRPTSLIPRSEGTVIYSNLTHMETKSATAPDQYFILTEGQLPPGQGSQSGFPQTLRTT